MGIRDIPMEEKFDLYYLPRALKCISKTDKAQGKGSIWQEKG
jgi:hypothetical protein